MRVYYYQGRIHSNAGQLDQAMRSFVFGLDASENAHDDFTLGLLCVMLGNLNLDIQQLDDARKYFSTAADIFDGVGRRLHQLESLKKVLLCRIQSDSLEAAADVMSRIEQVPNAAEDYPDFLNSARLYLAVNQADTLKIREAISQYLEAGSFSYEGFLDMALKEAQAVLKEKAEMLNSILVVSVHKKEKLERTVDNLVKSLTPILTSACAYS